MNYLSNLFTNSTEYLQYQSGYNKFYPICELKQYYFGAQDAALGKNNKSNLNYINTDDYITSVSIKPIKQLNNKLSFHLDKEKSCLGLLIKNLKFSHMHDIKCVELDIGGQRIDRIYASTFPALRKLFDMSEREIPLYLFKYGFPLLKSHDIKIHIELNRNIEDAILYYDIYNYDNDNMKLCSNPVSDSKIALPELILFQEQFTGTESVKKGENQIRCNFNHPIYYLLMEGNIEDDIILEMNGHYKLDLKMINCMDGVNMYELTPSLKLDDLKKYGLNFSRIDNAKLIINAKNDGEINIYGISYQGMKIGAGMAGMTFSK